MTIREQIIAMQLSCNLERALLLILDNCGCDESILMNDLASIKWDIQRSITPNNAGKIDAVVVGNANNFGITTRNVDLKIDTNNALWLAYNPKVYLERYKVFRQRGKDDGNGNTTFEDVKAGFFREDFNVQNNYNRVNEFIPTGDDTIDIKMQTYFKLVESNRGIIPIGVPNDYSNSNTAKQVFRFALELDVNGKTIKVNSPTFQVLCSWDENTRGFHFGIGYAYR
jgi:hypothetical protein